MLPDLSTLCPLNFGVSIAWKQILTSYVSLGGQSLSKVFFLLNGSFSCTVSREKQRITRSG